MISEGYNITRLIYDYSFNFSINYLLYYCHLTSLDQSL
uniref:Uncharacterized protein n=1 Tax=Vibrio tasmaniensis TaxID=212663 RepID=A0A0H3ZVT6_9VIBR|nr:hypothetical protein [Vibrio tasmaniensis]